MPKYTPDLTTPERIKRLRGFETIDSEDPHLIDLIHEASAYLQTETRRTFVPYVGTLYFDANQKRTLSFHEDVLAISAITNGDGASITGTQYRLVDPNLRPYWGIELLTSANTTWTYTNDRQNAVTVIGTLGFHEDYDHAWKSLTTIVGTLTVSGTTVGVGDTTNLDVLDYVRFATNDIRQITAISSAGTLTLEGSQLGTTPSTHNPGTAVEVYQVPPRVRRAANMLVSHMYERAPTAGNRIQFADGSVLTDDELPKEVLKFVATFHRRAFE